MRSFALATVAALSALALAGCCTTSGPGPSGPYYSAPRPMYRYFGPHPIPDALGGGWCFIQGEHVHDYAVAQPNYYTYQNNAYYYTGPTDCGFSGEHPTPGGGWCYIAYPHSHNYCPPAEYHTSYRWDPGQRVYVYTAPAPNYHGASPVYGNGSYAPGYQSPHGASPAYGTPGYQGSPGYTPPGSSSHGASPTYTPPGNNGSHGSSGPSYTPPPGNNGAHGSSGPSYTPPPGTSNPPPSGPSYTPPGNSGSHSQGNAPPSTPPGQQFNGPHPGQNPNAPAHGWGQGSGAAYEPPQPSTPPTWNGGAPVHTEPPHVNPPYGSTPPSNPGPGGYGPVNGNRPPQPNTSGPGYNWKPSAPPNNYAQPHELNAPMPGARAGVPMHGQVQQQPQGQKKNNKEEHPAPAGAVHVH